MTIFVLSIYITWKPETGGSHDLAFVVVAAVMGPVTAKGDDVGEEHPAVTKFRDYLRIKSVQPDPDYDGTNEFLKVRIGKHVNAF